MTKKILLPLLLFGFISLQADAQSFNASFSYQSFRPFVSFQLEIGNNPGYGYGYGYQDPYESAYIKGYMDGVNDAYYNDYRFYELVRNINAYEAGYRDGVQDRLVYLRLRGRSRLTRHPFAYADYYSPYYSVQIWLNQLSFTFIEAPAYRLPRHWARRAHPRLKRYRAWAHGKGHHKFQKKYKKYYNDRRKHLRKRSQFVQKKYRKNDRNYKRDSRRGPSRLNRARAIQRVKAGGHASSVRSRGKARQTRIQARGRASGKRVGKTKHAKRPNVRASSHGNSKERVKRSRSSRGKVKSRGSSKRKKVRSRSRRSKGSGGRVERQRKSRSKGKRSRGGSRSKRGKRGGN